MTSVRRSGTKGVARADREQQILDVAGQVFGEQGFAATSVADVAREAGISKPLIYNYFGSKEGLYERCLRHALDLILGEIERSADLGAVGLQRALVTLDGMFRVLDGRPWVWAVANDGTAPESAETLRSTYEQRLDGLAREGVGELLTLAGDDDALDVDAMTAVWSSVFASLVTWWCEHPGMSPDAMSDRCERLFDAVFGVSLEA